MTDQQTPDTSGEAPATTSYVVLVAVRVPEPDQVGTWTAWREVGVIDVPKRTTRASVVEQAKALAEPYVDAGTRMRVYPLVEHVEAELSMEQPAPQLTVTLL